MPHSPSRQRVVGAAIVRRVDGVRSVLVAQRAAPPHLAGLWEFPGGKVEPGEDDRAALARECHEELGVRVVVGEPLAEDVAIGDTASLCVYVTELTGSEQPTAIEHLQVRWVTAAEVDGLGWLPTNTPLLAPLRALLARPPSAEDGRTG